MVLMTFNFFFISVLLVKSNKCLIIVNCIGHFVVNGRWFLQLLAYDPQNMRLPMSQVLVQMLIQIILSLSVTYMSYMMNKNIKMVADYVLKLEQESAGTRDALSDFK